MINGAHSIIYSENPEADRAFFREVLGLPHVDAGEGFVIFGLPPAEVAIHDASDSPDAHQLYLMTHDVEALVETLDLRGTETTPIQDSGWGLVTEVTLPGGGKLPIYQPRHERPDFVTGNARAGSRRSSRKASNKPSAATKKPGKKVVKRAVKKAVKKVTKRTVKTAKAPKVSKPVRGKPAKPGKAKKAAKGSKTRSR